MSKFKHTLTAEVIDLESIKEWVVEADARRAINNHISFLSDHSAICDTQPKFINDQVSSDRDYPLFQIFTQPSLAFK